jgi:hypothetical protein
MQSGKPGGLLEGMLRGDDHEQEQIAGANVNIRLTHPKKSAVEHRVIIELGVIRQEAPATLAAGSDPGGQANATRTPLATAEFRHGPLV